MVLKKSLWKQISQAKDKQLILEARKSFSNEALQILSGKLSDAKAIEEFKEKTGAYFKESQARKEAQEVNKGQAAGGVAGHSQQPSKLASNLLLPIQPASNTSSLPPALASTLAPIAEAEEPNNDEAAQPKEDESEMDCATAVAIAVNQSAIADESALISNSIAIVTNSSIFNGSATKSVDPTGPAASITDSAIATNSIISTGPAAIITNSAIATRLAASNESMVPTGVETILAGPIAATGHSMDVNMTGPALLHPPDEIVPQCGHSVFQATQPPTKCTQSSSYLAGKRKADEHAEEAVAKKMKEA
ncbi:hypothetical protein E4T56_gene13171 [Termitomyces sp. T112]|nr:hypothetical protein E4T56_gene13171 [Termitomyces sp. T112]